MAIEVTTDFYVRLGIDRTLDEEGIRKHLNKLRIQNARRRQNPPSDLKGAALVEESKLINEALQTLCNKEIRQQYDKALQAAYDSGKIVSKQEKVYAGILEQAREFFNDRRYLEAIQLAQKLVDGHTNDVKAYDLLARCYWETGEHAPAVEVLNKATRIFGDTPELCELGADVLIDAGEFDMAQTWVNRLIQVDGGGSRAQAEQIYLHLGQSDENLAFQEIDYYITEHPEDGAFKKKMAHKLIAHQFAYYKEDVSKDDNDKFYIDSQEDYEKAVTVCEKAVLLYKDDETTKSLELARSYGEKSWNDWNVEPIKYTAGFGILTLILAFSAGGSNGPVTMPLLFALFLLVSAGVLVYYSFRPEWQIRRTQYTGEYGVVERIVHTIGIILYKWLNWSIRAGFWMFKLILRLFSMFWK